MERNRGVNRGVNRGARSQAQDRVLFPASSSLDRTRAVHVVCAVDDTDDITGDTSTGYVAERIADCVAKLGGEVSLGITRHQLLLSDDVAYTSHNSAMCFAALMPDDPEVLARFRAQAIEAVCALSVEVADPGLCIAVLHPAWAGAEDACEVEIAKPRAETERGTTEHSIPERGITERGIALLHAFGHAAQTRVCTKEEAYELAEQLPFVRLSEHGGTGLGVIGALAGVGLRLGGSDGRFRGKWDLVDLLGTRGAGAGTHKTGAGASATGAEAHGAGASATGAEAHGAGASATGAEAREASEECDALMAVDEFRTRMEHLVRGRVAVVDDTGAPIDGHVRMRLVREAKPILLAGALTFVLDAQMCPAEKIDLGAIGTGGAWSRVCERFALDNDVEECAPELERSCRNCLYRRWTESGFTCVIT